MTIGRYITKEARHK